ncbi:MAG: EAL domain-containing protein [Candidatus Eremiobacteraeota bacterium]|nr:EAL domain-containing protein [Candidatus Eremiobacteraeota bacterium]
MTSSKGPGASIVTVAGDTMRKAGHAAHYLLREAVGALRMELGTISRIDGESVLVYCRVGDGDAGTGNSIAYGTSLASLAVESGDIFESHDVAADARIAQHPMVEAFGLGAVAVMPFRGGGAQWALTLGSRKTREHGLTPDELAYLRTLEPALSDLVEPVCGGANTSRYAFYDMVTDLPNRAATISRLGDAIAQAERNATRAGLFFADLDDFKIVNDTFGHARGDTVLTEIAHRMRDTMRRDEFVGRLGGDEFAVIFPVVRTDEDLTEVANRIIEAVCAPIDRDNMRTHVNVSLGIAVYPDDGRTPEELLAHADVAMYRAKRQAGSAYYWYNRELDEDMRLRHELSNSLQNEQMQREFLLCFQPIVSTTGGSLAGAEALLRWLHPSMGLLPPKRFLNVAATAHLTSLIDSWVVETGFAHARQWQAMGLTVPIYINISAPRKEVLASVREGVATGHVDPALLRLELSESLAARDFEATRAFVRECRTSGLVVGLDQFGSGGLPIAKLALLELDFVKLDRDITASLFASPEATAGVDGLIALAKRFGWSIVAEGLENESQRQWLAAKGVEAVQGYSIAHPMTAIDFLAWTAAPSRP